MHASTQPGSIRVLMADHTRIGSQLIVEALRRDSRFHVMAVLAGSQELLSVLARFNPDVAVFGAGPNGSKGLGGLRQARLNSPGLRAILLLDFPADDLVVEAFRAGARGVICRDESVDVLVKCLHSVYQDQIWANNQQLLKVLEVLAQESVPRNLVDANGAALLSKRELIVVRLVAEGLTNREVAFQLQLSEHTIKNYLFRVFDKLGVSNRAELILYALSNRQLGPVPVTTTSATAHRGDNACRSGARQRAVGDAKRAHFGT